MKFVIQFSTPADWHNPIIFDSIQPRQPEQIDPRSPSMSINPIEYKNDLIHPVTIGIMLIGFSTHPTTAAPISL